MSESVEILIKADDQASQKMAAAASNAAKAGDKINNSFKDAGKNTKAISDLAGVIASLTGNSQLAGLAGQLGEVTDKVSQFSEVSKAGAAGSLAFKAGLVGLVAAGGFAFGKWLGDIIFETAKFERALAETKEEAKRLDDQLKQLAQTRFGETKQDIELIRDPEEKRAAYKKLLGELQRDIGTAGAVAAKSKREAEKWADAWQITGNRKQYAEDAKNQAAADRERVDALKAQAQEIGKIVGQRTLENELIKAANAEKDKSESYLDTLRKEVEYLKATREEQIKLDAARNTTDEDQGEAERLLKERDAIIAKIEAEKELERVRIHAEEEAAKAAENAEKERLKAIEDQEKAAKEELGKRKTLGETAINATEGRLLSRGPASSIDQLLLQQNNLIVEQTKIETQNAFNTQRSSDTLEKIDKNTSINVTMVPVS